MTARETIAAISTPLGEGGIGIVRISGEEAFRIGKKIFVPKKIPPVIIPGRTIFIMGTFILSRES